MTSLNQTASWVIVSIETGKPVFETFCYQFADTINKKRYKAIPILEYLQAFNKGVKHD